MTFAINSNELPLAAKPVNRAAHRRTDPKGLDEAFHGPSALVFLMKNGEPLLNANGTGLLWLGPEAARFDGMRLFLGEDTSKAPIFALDIPETFNLEASPIAGLGAFSDMRAAAASLGALDANLAATARSLFEWHHRHGFCANCGAPSAPVEAGWKRICPSCGAEHFPRTDPVAIMLAVHGDMCLLGRSPGWPAGFLSCLAGFVEPGETFEQAAARELEEEAGIKADPSGAEYLFCQPWPFPSSLMVGLILEAETTDIQIDPKELEAAQWVSREEARQILSGTHPSLYAPPAFAVAHHILAHWVARGQQAIKNRPA